jgi:hypothetical protein
VQLSWTCKCCDRSFDTLPMSYGIDAPRNWFALSVTERAIRAELSDDACIIDGKEFYVRGCVEIPVLHSTETFVWGVWVSVSEESFRYIHEKRNAPIADDEPPRFAWLDTWIQGYPDPTYIKCHLYLRSGNLRPRIVLEPTDYPLAVEQRQGINVDRVKQIFADSSH